MIFSRVNLVLLLLVGLFHATHSVAQSRENIVLLPIEVSPEYANQENLIGIALQQSLNKNFNVFYGDSVEAALQAEYAKEDCSAESCVQNIAILFNGEIIVDASVQRVENSAFLSVQFRNIITGELEAVVQDACRECSFTQLTDFIDERVSDIALNSSQGLTALLEKQAKPLTSSVATPQREQPKPSVTVSQEPINPRPKVAKSSSYWKWGLGALALVAGGGGGGGDTTTPALDPTTPAPYPGSGSSDEPEESSDDEWPNVVAMFRRAESEELTGVINEDFRRSRSEAQRELLPSVSTDGTELEFSIPSNGGYQVAGASTFDVSDFFDSGSSLYDADFADGVKVFYETANNLIFLEVEVGAGDTSFGALRYDDTSFPSDISTNRWVAAAFYSGTETPNDIFTSQSNSVSFNGRSAGHLAGHHTVSDIDLDVNFQNQSFTLASSNTQSTQSIANAPSVDRTELDFTITGRLRGNRFPASSTDIDIEGAVVKSLDIRSYGQNLHTLGGGWVVDVDDTVEDYLGVFGAIQ